MSRIYIVILQPLINLIVIHFNIQLFKLSLLKFLVFVIDINMSFTIQLTGWMVIQDQIKS